MSSQTESGTLQPDYRRVLTTVALAEPDRVPLVELAIDRPIKEAFLGRPVRDVETDVEFWRSAGYDYIYLRPNYEYTGVPRQVAAGTTLAAEASTDESESISTMAAGVITKQSDLETYDWPDPEKIDYSPLVRAANCLSAGMGLITGVGGIFTRTWLLLGLERFSHALFEEPELIAELSRRIGEIQCAVLRRAVQMDRVVAIWYGDDLGYTEGLLASPKVFRRYFFPWMEELATIAHSNGLPFIFHSDGKLDAILPDLVALGVNALHPVEPKAMDIRAVKARWGRQLAVFGNLDLGSTLVTGSPDDVRAEVRSLIRDLGPGGGYAVSSSNSISRYVPLDNYNALREAVFEYGPYPIRL